MKQPKRRLIRTARDAELVARDWMRFMGYADAWLTRKGKDMGIDVNSTKAIAQVKARTTPVGRPIVQQTFGVGQAESKQSLVFSMAGFTDEAIEWGDNVGMALFTFNRQNEVKPLNRTAESLLRKAKGLPAPWEAVETVLAKMADRRIQAIVEARFELRSGYLGYWMVRSTADGGFEYSGDFAGSHIHKCETLGEAITEIRRGLRSLDADYWDCAVRFHRPGEPEEPFEPVRALT